MLRVCENDAAGDQAADMKLLVREQNWHKLYRSIMNLAGKQAPSEYFERHLRTWIGGNATRLFTF